ncbi:hypothetical protein IWX63_002859 [Arthrobacter sp. CAN_A2]
MKVTLDEQLGRETSPEVKSLAEIKLPPIKAAANQSAVGWADAETT